MRIGDKSNDVKKIQYRLIELGYAKFNADGDFGKLTHNAVLKFQSAHKLIKDGIVGQSTRSILFDLNTDRMGKSEVIEDIDGKLSILDPYYTADNLLIHRAYLDTNEYVRDYGKLDLLSFFIHHSGGWDNPFKMIGSWNDDQRGRVCTQYAIGGYNIRGNSVYNGDVVECFPNNYIGWHLGKVGNFNISKFSVGVELNNFGQLTKKNNKYYTYVGSLVPDDQVCDLGYAFRGYRYWHKYSDEQIESLRLLILHINKIYPKIDLHTGLIESLRSESPSDAFEFNDAAYNGKHGMWTHTNVRTDKFDCSPQPNLIKMLLNVNIQ